MYKRTGFQILHAILGFIILLNILDFLEVLNPFWDYVKKIISWFLVGVLFYRLSPSNVLLGVKRRSLDFWFVAAAFSLTINDMVRYAVIMRENMILSAQYVGFFQEPGVAASVINVTEEAWNSLSILGLVPDAATRLFEYASQLTMSAPVLHVAFSYAGEQVTYAVAPIGLSGSLLTVYNSLFPLSGVIQAWGLLLGMLGLLAWALAALRVEIHEKSVLGLLGAGRARGKHVVARFVLLFLVAVFFFLFVFSLVMEWLAIAIDAPILMIALLTSVFLIIVRHERFSVRQWEEWVTHVGAEYVEPFMDLFTQRRTVLLGVSGLLVLHLLTEVLNYLLPFVLPMRDQLYLAQLGPGHDNIFSLIDFSGSLVQDGAVVLVAFANVIAWFGLLTIPGYIWYKLYRLRTEDHPRHHPSFSPFSLGLFSASLLIMLLAPMIWFKKLSESGLVGVDFYTQPYASPLSPVMIVLWGLAIFVLVFFSAQFGMRRYMYLIPLLSSVLFMGVYAYVFFLSSFEYYLLAGLSAFSIGAFGLGAIFSLFLLYTAAFYASGYVLFIYEIVRD